MPETIQIDGACENTCRLHA